MGIRPVQPYVPLSDEQIYAVAKSLSDEDAAPLRDVVTRPNWEEFVDVCRAIERAVRGDK